MKVSIRGWNIFCRRYGKLFAKAGTSDRICGRLEGGFFHLHFRSLLRRLRRDSDPHSPEIRFDPLPASPDTTHQDAFIDFILEVKLLVSLAVVAIELTDGLSAHTGQINGVAGEMRLDARPFPERLGAPILIKVIYE